LRKAVEKDPTFIEARFALAQALLAHGDFDAARSEFETVVKQAPGRADAVNGLGITFLRQGQTSQAIVRFDQALELKPDFAEAAENLRIARASESRFQSRLKP
jgi:Flp pilus assembly protein TadD